MTDVIAELRQAMSEFDGAGRVAKPAAAREVLALVRRLLAEVDGVRAAGGAQFHVDVEPLGGPIPGVNGSHLPERDDDYTAAAMNRTLPELAEFHEFAEGPWVGCGVCGRDRKNLRHLERA